MKSLSNNKKIILFDIDYTFFDTAKFKKSNLSVYSVYKEVIPTLSLLQKVATLGIFSEGDPDLQFKKLQETDVMNFFSREHMQVVDKKDGVVKTVLKRYKDEGKVFLVDDKLTILHTVKKIMPSIYCIWIKRGEYAIKQKAIGGFLPDAEVKTLDELVHIIKKE